MTAPPADGTATSAEMLALGRRTYAFGLRWTSAASRRSLVAEALAAARAEKAGHVVLHRGFNQFGLAADLQALAGVLGAGRLPRSGAAAIAASIGPATLAAFPLDDGRWLVLAIDRKGFLPDGDTIVADGAAAKARVEQLIAQSPTSWRRKLVPQDWNISDSRSVSPNRLLGRSRAPSLVPLWLLANRRRLAAGAVATVSLVLLVALLAIHQILSSPPAIFLPPPPPKSVAAVWTPAGLAIDRCLSAMRDAQRYATVPGWPVVKYACQGGEGLTVSFARKGDGQIGMIRGLVPSAQLSDDGRSAILALPLPALPRISATGRFAPRARYQLTGLDVAQRLNGAFALQAARAPLPGEAKDSVRGQDWAAFTWTYQTQAPALAWAGAIARLGSISVDTLVLTPTDDLWQLTGTLYASN